MAVRVLCTIDSRAFTQPQSSVLTTHWLLSLTSPAVGLHRIEGDTERPRSDARRILAHISTWHKWGKHDTHRSRRTPIHTSTEVDLRKMRYLSPLSAICP
jgi:hypothetical protein